MANASFVLLPDRGVLAVSGPDRRPFLQGLVSNDVDKIGPTAAQYAALLTAQGKYLYDFIIIEVGESLWVDAEVLRLSELKKRLSLYRLRAKVELDEKAELGVAAVLGKGAAAAFDLPDSLGAARTFGGGVVFVDPRLVSLRVRAILPRETARTILIDAGLVEENAEVYDRLRLSLGIPDGSRDLVLEKSILLESGFDELHGVDWEKGCYIGQELTARTKYRGLIKKRLMPVQIDGPAPFPGTIITADGREVGEMRSSRNGLGLALLRLEPVIAKKTLISGQALIRPIKPSWMNFDIGEAATD
jgi:tRNA-modifying protein YgfZ